MAGNSSWNLSSSMPARRLKPGAARSAPLFAALGDETRLRLVSRLCTEGPASITRLASDAAISRQAITKHLRVLARAGVVRGLRHGREQLYELDPHQLRQAREYLDIVSRQWDDALDRLKMSLEDD